MLAERAGGPAAAEPVDSAGCMPRAVLVVPCFNEADRLPIGRFAAFAEASREVDFVLVDDGSTDATRERLRDLERIDPDRFAVVECGRNRGKAEAVRAGVLRAFERSPAYVGYWDADLATPLDESSRFVRVLESSPGCEVVFGARVQLLGRSIHRRPLRHYLGRVFATLASQSLGLPIYDTQCGAKLFRATPATRALFSEEFLTRWLFDVELVARMIAAGGEDGRTRAHSAIYELPLETWHDVGASKVHAFDFARAAVDLVRIRWHYGRPAR